FSFLPALCSSNVCALLLMNSRAAWKNEESTYLLSPFNATIRGSYKNLLPKGRKVDHSNHCNFQ
ncbi:hypothetical protein S83_030973, partial [Arachis hypogaea]